ncbi:MAG TPA: aminodeoxychorismate synthase component I [Fusobacterium sp.]|uniref:aminodeoxychorismate synthase component I n=1 Tax=Fusobacterium sp. TaxID=68766 RepID=UPI002F3FD2FA
MRTLLIDNYDSYTYNLYQMIVEVTGKEVLVIKNDEYSWEEVQQLAFDVVVISPGPGSPEKKEDFGVCEDILRHCEKPIFGVCLGHQGIYHIFGGEVGKAPVPMHGRLSRIYHEGRGIFQNLEQGMQVVRYHSLLCKGEVPKCLQVDARTEEGLIMALSHKTKPIWGVQFHPESICTENGKEMMENFFHLSREYYEKQESFVYEKIDFSGEGEDIFRRLYPKFPTLLWLDSSKVEEGLSRFSIFGMSSLERGYSLLYKVDHGILEKKYENGKVEKFQESIFDYLQTRKKNWRVKEELPFDFQLGYIGYFGYELKQECVMKNRHSYENPDAFFRYVDRAVILDHLEKKLYFLSEGDDRTWMEEVKNLLQRGKTYQGKEHFASYPRVAFVSSRKQYLENIRKSQDLIAQGESYEICLTNRLELFAKVCPVDYYLLLRKISPAPYSAFFPCETLSLASSSMEKFLTIDREGKVETKPIKGTIRRGSTVEEDEKYKRSLAEEEKNQSENLMIVDLLRNDLGKVCDIASVTVPKLMTVESYSTLHQLVSTVRGKVSGKYDAIDVIKACFPGGSMTGAPKKRTLEIIDSLESVPRGVYSGSIGFLSHNGTADFNIVIRTAVIEEEKVSLGVGGAIIALSNPEEEFQEILLKAKGVLKAFQLYFSGNMEEEIQIEGSEA